MILLQEYTVRANRGRPRIWLEGKRLAAAGFERGVRFDLTLGTKRYGGLLLYLNEDGSGKRKVSGKGDRPIVDIVGAEIQRCGLQSGDDVVVTYDCEVSEILIRRKENA
tara:strand:+ start:1650 stop:1976 length:327 start_codon:yes stop_codon:yes gene_type:complete